MATSRVDTGNIQLRQPGGVPMRQIEPRPVQYIAGKVEAEYGQAMGQLLDRMSSNLFEYAGKLRSEEGLKWAAENQITEQQLEDITGGKPGETVNIGAGNIVEQGKVIKSLASMLPSKFNEAVMKFRSAELSYKLEQQAISKMSTMLEGIDRGPGSTVSSKNIIQEINTITNAHYQVLAGVDPAAANRYNATMATHGNAVYKAALKAEAEYNKRKRTTDFIKTVNEEQDMLDRQIQENPTTIDFIYGAGLARLKEAILHEGIGFEAGAKYINDYQKKYINGKIDVISKHFMSGTGSTDDVYGTLLKIQKRDAGNYTSLLAGMDTESVEKITANVMTAYTQREQVKNNKQQEDKLNAEIQANKLLAKILPLNKNDPTRKKFVEEVISLNVLSYNVQKDLLEPDKAAVGNGNTAYNALVAIRKNEITTTEALDKIPGLSIEQRTSLVEKLFQQNRESSKILEREIRKLSGLPTADNVFVNLDPSSNQFKLQVQLEREAEEIRNNPELLSKNKGAPLTDAQIANILKERVIVRRSSIAAKQAEESLDKYTVDREGKPKKNRAWITGPINSQTLGVLKQKAMDTKDPKEIAERLRQITELESLIEAKQGNR
jgi:hypothetical protein